MQKSLNRTFLYVTIIMNCMDKGSETMPELKSFFGKSYNVAFVSITCVVVLVWLIISLLSWDWRKKELKSQIPVFRDDKIFDKAFRNVNLYRTAMMFWTMAGILFVVVPSIANIITILNSWYIQERQGDIVLYSILSTALIVVAYAVKPQKHERCYRRAYTILDNAVNKYVGTAQNREVGVEEFKKAKNELIDAMGLAERCIDPSYDADQ